MLMPHANKRNFLPKKKTRDELWISLLLVANFHEAALASQSDDGTPLYQCWENWSHHFVLVLSLASLLSQCGQTTIDNTVIPLNTDSKEHGFTSDLQKGTWLYSVWGSVWGTRHICHVRDIIYAFIGMVHVIISLFFFFGIVVVLVDLWCSPR